MSVRYALTWGIILVLVPTLVIAIILPIAATYFFIDQNISLWYLILLVMMAFVLGQLWWRITVVKWKIWAYSKVNNLRALHASAQQIELLHDGQYLQHWEIVSRRDRPVLDALNQALKKAKTNSDVSPSIAYYFSRTKIVATTFIMHLFAVLGILVLWQNDARDFYFYMAVLFLGLYFLMYFFKLPLLENPVLAKSFQNLFSWKPQLHLTPEGIHIQDQNIGFIPWKKIKNFHFTNTKAKQELRLFAQITTQEYQKLLIPLEDYALEVDELEQSISHYLKLA